jgi:hypothetical protein
VGCLSVQQRKEVEHLSWILCLEGCVVMKPGNGVSAASGQKI